MHSSIDGEDSISSYLYNIAGPSFPAIEVSVVELPLNYPRKCRLSMQDADLQKACRSGSAFLQSELLRCCQRWAKPCQPDDKRLSANNTIQDQGGECHEIVLHIFASKIELDAIAFASSPQRTPKDDKLTTFSRNLSETVPSNLPHPNLYRL